MGTFFATHEAELYHYGRKGMRRGRHLPDVLDPTRALVGTRASSGEALTTRFYDRYKKDKASRQAVRTGRESLRGVLSNNKSYNPDKVNAERDNYETIKKYVTGKHFSSYDIPFVNRTLRKHDRKSTEESSSDAGISRSLGTMAKFGQSRGPHKTSRDYSVEYRTRHRVAQRQEEAKREAERNAAKNAMARGYATKTASRAAASGASTGNAVRELNRQVGQERLKMSTAKATDESGRRAYEKERTRQSEANKRIRNARYRLNTIDAANAEQRARKKTEDTRTQDSRTNQLQREARETRKRNGEIRRIRDYNARVAMPRYLSKKAQAGAAEAIRANERRRTEASQNQFSKMPKWKQNLERAKSQKAASENAEHVRRKKQYTELQRRRHLEENRGRKSKRPY